MNKTLTSNKDLTVAIVGTGNVATHLMKALGGKCRLIRILPRTPEDIPSSTDIALIAVKDDAITEVADKIAGKAGIVAHTSGSVPMSALAGAAGHTGVFYPLQTFSKGVELNYSEIPVFIEGDCTHTVESLSVLAGLFSDNVIEADSSQRKQLHLASVFACNFSNRLAGIADMILRDAGMDYKVLLPLLRQTISKLETLSPDEAQTGPAAREDMNVINSHLDMLKEKPRLQRIYSDITNEIISTHNNH